MKTYLKFWRNTFNFKGIASRKEMLPILVADVIIIIIDVIALSVQNSYSYDLVVAMGGAVLVCQAYALISLLPTISCMVRRFHDLNMSGAWVLSSFVPILGVIMFFIALLGRSNHKNNRWCPSDEVETESLL